MNVYDKEVVELILAQMPVGVIVFDEKMGVIYHNRGAEKFINRHDIPPDVTTLCKRIFDAISTARVKELFPGEIYLYKKLEGSTSNWTFRFHIHERPRSFVNVFIIEETVSNKLNMNEIRMRYRLTRRETDVVRRVLDGRKNREIAEDLEISEQTVKDYLSNIYVKMGVTDRYGLLSVLLGSSEP